MPPSHQYRGRSPASQVNHDAEPLRPVTAEALCELHEVPDGGVLERVATVSGDAESLLLLRRGDAVRVVFNVCPHAGRRLDFAPGRFMLDGGLLVCAAHGAAFTIPDGECIAGPCRGERLREVPATVRDGRVWLDGA